jgi:hypothetical protein
MKTILKVNANTTGSDDKEDSGDPKKGIKPVLTAQAILINISFEPGICARLRYLTMLENFSGMIETLYAIPNKDAKKTQKNASKLTVSAKTEDKIAATIPRTTKMP